MKKTLQKVKFFVSLLLLVFIFYQVDIPEIYSQVRSINIFLYIIALIIAFLRIFLSSFRWQRLLIAKNIHARFFTLSGYYFIATFYNLFLPTALGGDAIRIYSLSKRYKDKKTAISSIIIERLLGFLSLCFLGYVGVIFGLSKLQKPGILLILIIATCLLLLSLFALLNKKATQLFFAILDSLPFNRFNLKVKSLHQNFLHYSKHKVILLENYFISLIFQIAGVIKIALLGLAIGIEIEWIDYLIFVPVIWILIMIPVSISGIGLREGAFVSLFLLVGVEKETALLLSLLEFSQSLVTGFTGGLVQIFNGIEMNKYENKYKNKYKK